MQSTKSIPSRYFHERTKPAKRVGYLGSALLALVASNAAAADFDLDGVDDRVDNCSQRFNPVQQDKDGDGYGNACDADFDNDETMSASDTDAMRVALTSQDLVADLDGDGTVGPADVLLFETLYHANGSRPGPGRVEPFSYPVLDIPGITCLANTKQAGCVISVLGMEFETPRSNIVVFDDQSGFQVVGDMGIRTPAPTPIPMPECSITFQRGPNGTIQTLRGTARVPFPAEGFLKEIKVTRQPMATIGVDLGRNLDALEAPILPDRQYLFFHLNASYEASIGPVSMSTPGADITLILDPTDPFFYVAGDLGGFAPGGDQKSKKDTDSNGSTSNTTPDHARDTNAGENDSTTQDEESDSSIGNASFGFSKHGLIPFQPVNTRNPDLEPFSGHLYVSASLPIAPLPLSLAGEFVYDLDPDGDGDHPFDPVPYVKSIDLTIGANGVLSLEVPFLKVFSFGFELGDASVRADWSDSEVWAAFSGSVEPDLSFLEGLPIPIRPEHAVHMAGMFGMDFATGEIREGSFLSADSTFSIGASVLGELIGVDLSNLASVEGSIYIDQSGLRLQGQTSSQIGGGIGFQGEMGITVFVAADGKSSSLTIEGNMTVGGKGLEHATLTVNQDGMFVTGTFVTDLTIFEMSGNITTSGYKISGSAEIADPIELNVQKTAGLVDDIANNEHVVMTLNANLSATEVTVRTLHDQVTTAKSGVTVAQRTVNSLNSQINGNKAVIAKRKREIAKYRRKKCKWHQASCHAKKAAAISSRSADIGRREATNRGLYIALSTAKFTLSAAQQGLSTATESLASAQSTVASVRAMLNAARTKVAELRDQLDKLPVIEGTLRPTVTLTLQNGKLSGSVEAEWNDRLVANGTVTFNPGRACLQLPSAGKLCANF